MPTGSGRRLERDDRMAAKYARRAILTIGCALLPALAAAQTPAASAPPPGTRDSGYREQPPAAITRFPGDGSGAYKTRRYRDLFAEQLGTKPGAARAKMEAAFQQFFHGDG